MEIKGPTAPRAVDVQSPTSVRPTAPGNAATPPATPQVAANTLRLSPALFQVGQVFDVVVAKVESNALLLMLQNPILDENGQRINLQLRAPVNLAAAPGQQLTVQVKNIVNGVPQLQVVASASENLNPANVLHIAQQQQRPLPPFYANLADLQQLQNKQLLAALPAQVRERIQALWRSLPDTNQIQKPTGLKQAMHYSGPFLESALLNMAQGHSQSYPAMDVQAGLLRLAAAIRAQLAAAQDLRNPAQQTHTPSGAETRASIQAPMTEPSSTTPNSTNKAVTTNPVPPAPSGDIKPMHPEIPQAQARTTATLSTLTTEHLLNQLLQQTEGGLARILTQQLHAASHDTQRPLWLLELPVRHDNGVDVFDLRIQRDADEQGHAGERAQHTWTVMLAFDLQGLGAVRAQVSLVQDQISTFWWADQSTTVDLFHQHMDQLQHRITAAGLKVNKLQCQQGIPDTNQPVRNVPISNVIVDEKI
ncbi:MAG: hypothetical protein GC149_18105 [Gammaproteobacteria bacterium]|nr:hypothetical protein [Gammaproteobacteria bacterium]